MAREIHLRRSPAGPYLIPDSDVAEEALAAIPSGKSIRVKLDSPRNLKLHRRFWLLCSRVSEMLHAYGREESPEVVAARLKVACGVCTVQPAGLAVFRATGCNMIAIPGSIAFHTMDDDQFREFFKKCEAFILSELLPHIPTREWRERIGELVTD